MATTMVATRKAAVEARQRRLAELAAQITNVNDEVERYTNDVQKLKLMAHKRGMDPGELGQYEPLVFELANKERELDRLKADWAAALEREEAIEDAREEATGRPGAYLAPVDVDDVVTGRVKGDHDRGVVNVMKAQPQKTGVEYLQRKAGRVLDGVVRDMGKSVEGVVQGMGKNVAWAIGSKPARARARARAEARARAARAVAREAEGRAPGEKLTVEAAGHPPSGGKKNRKSKKMKKRKKTRKSKKNRKSKKMKKRKKTRKSRKSRKYKKGRKSRKH